MEKLVDSNGNCLAIGVYVRIKGDRGRIVEVCQDLILVEWIESGAIWESPADVRMDTKYRP